MPIVKIFSNLLMMWAYMYSHDNVGIFRPLVPRAGPPGCRCPCGAQPAWGARAAAASPPGSPDHRLRQEVGGSRLRVLF